VGPSGASGSTISYNHPYVVALPPKSGPKNKPRDKPSFLPVKAWYLGYKLFDEPYHLLWTKDRIFIKSGLIPGLSQHSEEINIGMVAKRVFVSGARRVSGPQADFKRSTLNQMSPSQARFLFWKRSRKTETKKPTSLAPSFLYISGGVRFSSPPKNLI
jgi:hypothetical protein